jgi:SAM-dependent methyltransferase
MLFTRAGLEQASGEPTARHRAERVHGHGADRVLDLCCGIGGDLIALARSADVTGVDRDETHAFAARHNAAVYGVPTTTVVADVNDVRLPAGTAVFVDPARRERTAAGDRRGGYTPPLQWCFGLPADRVCVKAAPGLDRAVVPAGWEVEFVALGRELREAVLWSPTWAGAAARATVIADDEVHILVPDPGTPAADVRAPGRYLLDPSPAVTRAGAVADLAGALGAWQVDPMIAFLSADQPLRSPYGRGLVIEASLPFSVKALAGELRRLDIGAVDLRRRGLAGDVDDIRRRLRPRGSRRATVALTRVGDRPWAFVCTELGPA